MNMDHETRVDELMQQVYDDAFDDAYVSFILRKQNDPQFTRDFLQGLLDSLYVQQGNNWTGRGQTKEAAHSALIAAAELVLSRWDHPEPEGDVGDDAPC